MLTLAVFLPRTLLASQACLTGNFSALPAVHVDTTGHTDSNPPNSFDGGASLYSGTFDIQIDGGPVTQAYCVDLVHNITSNDCVPQVAPPTYSNPCEVTYILNTFFPTGSNPGPQSDDVEAAAVQAAICSTPTTSTSMLRPTSSAAPRRLSTPPRGSAAA